MLLLHPDLPPSDTLRALALTRAAPGAWLPLLLGADAEGKPVALPISLGWAAAPAEIARWADGDPDADVVELSHALARVARARHDLNNPLTSAMAETQLALLDTAEPEVRAGLEVVEEQLRRMRDMIMALTALRPPR